MEMEKRYYINNRKNYLEKDNRIIMYQNIKIPNMDITTLQNNCNKISNIIYPHPINPKFFRGAGAKLIKWPKHFDDLYSDDEQDYHAFHRLYWIIDKNHNMVKKKTSIWFNWDTDLKVIHPYTVSERVCNLVQFASLKNLDCDFKEKIFKQIYRDARGYTIIVSIIWDNIIIC